MIYVSKYKSPLGEITLASDGENLIGLWIEGQKYFFSNLKQGIEEKNDLKIFCKTKKWLDRWRNCKQTC